MALLRSLLFALVFYTGSAVIVVTGVPAALGSAAALRAWVRGWAGFHRWCTGTLLGIRSRVEGQLPSEPALLAIKHQSMFETVEIVALLDRSPAVVLKQELLSIPFWGWLARRYGMIPVEREGGARALRALMRAADAAIAEGRPIVIFPEGTRVAPGDRPPLQSGFAGLYKMLKLPVVAVAVDSGRLWPRHRFVKHPGIVTWRVAPALPPGLPRQQVEAAVHESINALEA